MMQLTRPQSLNYISNLHISAARKSTTQLKNGQKTWIDISPRKIDRWPISTWKNAQHPWLLEKCKSKLPWDTTSHQSEWPSLISPQITSAGGDVEKREPSCTVGGNVSWHSHYGEQYGRTLEIYTQNYHMTQQSHSWAYIRTKLSLKKTHAPTCSLQHYSQEPRHENNPNVHGKMTGLGRCGIYTQWNTTQP